MKLSIKFHKRENDISEDHWTWPKYSEENNYGQAQIEDGHINFLSATNIIHDL